MLLANTLKALFLFFPLCASDTKFWDPDNVVQDFDESFELWSPRTNALKIIESKEIIDGYFKPKYNQTTDQPKQYEPDWQDLDSRPLPEWYDKAKIGIMLHWGVFSVPAFVNERFWHHWKAGNKQILNFISHNYPPEFTYQDFAPMFKAEFFEPDVWTDVFVKSGAKYVVLSTKHHEGYTLFPSKQSPNWNSIDVGPHRDLVGDLARAVRNRGLKFGIYYSLLEWYNSMYIKDKAAKFHTYSYRNKKLWPDITQLVVDYKPSIVWADGDWEADTTYWNSTNFLVWLYNDSPVRKEVVVNDRWGRGTGCKHGDFYTRNCRHKSNIVQLQEHKWENVVTIDRKSWGYRRNINIRDIMTVQQLVELVVTTVSCGGNVLINVGPKSDGTIALIFQEKLLVLGEWLKTNGEAIYSTSPWLHQNDTMNGNVWYTCFKTEYNARRPIATPQKSETVTAIYATFFDWPENNVLVLKAVSKYLQFGEWQVTMLGRKETLDYKIISGKTYISLPRRTAVKSNFAWSIKITYQI